MRSNFYLKVFLIATFSFVLGPTSQASADLSATEKLETKGTLVSDVKQKILILAESYEGQGDPDSSKQRKLERLVVELLRLNPQAPLADRLPLLYGSWKQVWGPYKYGDDSRGVDPSIDPKNIYQVVFDGGYYYNVGPNLDKSGKIKSTGLLRGEYKLDGRENLLKVQFTNLRKIPGTPEGQLSYADLPALSEARQLKGESTVLPGFLVRWFFGGGYLREVYTDQDLRITFGSDENDLVKNYIYIMKRVAP